MKLRKIIWKLGLTEEEIIELSNILYEKAIVTSKNYKNYDDWIISFNLNEDEEEYLISFRGQKTSFCLDNRLLFGKFKIGDEARIGYKERYEVILDYIFPNFDEKKQIDKKFLGYKFINAKKISAEEKIL